MAKSPMEVAEAAFTSGDLDHAEVLCRELLLDHAVLAAASHLLGMIALRRKKPHEAVQWIERAISSGLSSTIVLSNCGEAYRQSGRLEDAYARLEQALRADNTNAYAHFNLGLVMRSLGYAKESEHFFITALSLRPDLSRAHGELAELYRQEGHVKESEREYAEALTFVRDKEDETSLELFLQWGVRFASLLRERGKLLQSLELLEDVLQRREHAAAHFETAKVKFELSWEGPAREHYVRATQLQHSLGFHVPPRILSVRLASIKAWSESGHGKYTFLARSQYLSLPQLRTIPAAAKEGFALGKPITPELGCALVENAEILPKDMTVLSGDQLLVGGVVNWFQHYARRGQFVRHEADDGRVMLDLPAPIQRHDGACILLGKADDQYAWLYESLARLWIVEQLPALADLPLVISSDIPEERLAMLNSFGIPESRLLRITGDGSFVAQQLHLPSLPILGDWISPLALQFLRRRLSGRPDRTGRRIYLSRDGAPDRRLANEAELQVVLGKAGFEVINIMGKGSMELISILREAHAVIGIDDDTMANLVVCPQGVRIGIIATGGAYRPRAHFICGQLAQELTYLVGETRYESNPVHALCDIFLPEQTLSAFLKEIGDPVC